MLNGTQLRKLFQQFNAQYFDGRLPSYSIRVVDRKGRCNGEIYKQRRLIEIQSEMPEDLTISFLVHEMAHAATSEHHGMPWKREMIRLRKAGAPLIEADRRIKLDDWDGVRVSKKQFRPFVEDALFGGAPNITLNAAVRGFIHDEGGAKTISEFLKRYPWARQMFRNLKKERTEYEKRRAKLRAQRAADQQQKAIVNIATPALH